MASVAFDDRATSEPSSGSVVDPPPSLAPTVKKGPWFLWITFNLPLVIIAVSFPAKDLVSKRETSFVGFAMFYIFFLSRVLSAAYSGKHSPRVLEPSKLLALYIFLGTAMVGFVWPLAYFGYAYHRGIEEGMAAVAPVIYLLACQLVTQYVANGLCFSLPARALISILYNSRILFAAYNWYVAAGHGEQFLKTVDGALHGKDLAWVRAGNVLATTNLAYWVINLFVFLLPVYLPQAFKIHYDLERAARKKKK